MQEKRRAAALEALATLGGANSVDDDADGPVPSPPAQPSVCRTLLGRIGDASYPVALSTVEEYIRGNSARGGLTKVAEILRSRRTIFLDNPGGAHLPDPGQPDRRCVDKTPGCCAASHMHPQRVKDLAKFLHLQHLQHAREGSLQALIMLFLRGGAQVRTCELRGYRTLVLCNIPDILPSWHVGTMRLVAG